MTQIVIGREPEKRKLDTIMQSKQAEFLAIYGRRRVGKTYLIRQYLSKQIVFDLSGQKEATLEIQLENFFAEYKLRTKSKKQKTAPANWQEAFQLLNDYLIRVAKTKKNIVVFLDEMPWMDTPKSNFIGALEHFWNQYASKINNLLLVACGSASSWILKKLIRARGGLYNRVTHRIKLKPFTLAETKLFLQANHIQLTPQLITEIYMVMGGIPHYLKEIKSGQSTAQIINNLCFKENGLLLDEYDQIYYSIFKNASTHISIVNTLAKHYYGLTQHALVQVTKLPQSSISKALVELVDCDFISTGIPFNKKKKDTIYRLTDNYSLFYNKFIKNAKAKTNWQSMYNSAMYKSWCGYAFENICFLHVSQIQTALGIAGITSNINAWFFAGNANYNKAQIDMLIDRADKCVTICEVKYTEGNFALNKTEAEKLQKRRTIFKSITNTKKNIFTTLISLHKPVINAYYLQEFQSYITHEQLFNNN